MWMRLLRCPLSEFIWSTKEAPCKILEARYIIFMGCCGLGSKTFKHALTGMRMPLSGSLHAQLKSTAMSAHSDSLMETTLQAYGRHRQLDKIMAAAFVRIDKDDKSSGTCVHDWNRWCYEVLGVMDPWQRSGCRVTVWHPARRLRRVSSNNPDDVRVRFVNISPA